MRIYDVVQVSQKKDSTDVSIGTIQHIDYEFKNIAAKDWGKSVRYYIKFNDQEAYDRWLVRGSMLYILMNNVPKKCYVDTISDDTITVVEHSEKIVHPSNCIMFNVKKNRIESMLITEAAYYIV